VNQSEQVLNHRDTEASPRHRETCAWQSARQRL